MSHNVEYILNLVDRFSEPLKRLDTGVKSSTTNFNKLQSTITSAQKSTAGFDKMRSSIEKMPHSIEDLRNKLKELNAQLETTHSKKSFQNLQTEIKKTEKDLLSLTKQAKSFSSTGAGIGSWLKGGLAAMGASYLAYKAFDFGKEAVKAFDEEAKNKAQIRTGLSSTHHAAGRTLEQLTGQAEALEGTTLFTHGETEKAQSQLLVFSKIHGKVFDDAIKAAQDLATRYGIDLPAATKMVGKSLQDPEHGMRMLRLAGINFTDDQMKGIKKLIKQGDLYKVQLAILKGFQENLGGSAAAAAQAGIGPIQQLTNKWHGLTEIIGEGFAKSLNKLSPVLGGFIDNMKQWIGTPASEKLEDERIHVNALVNQLLDHNIKAERRNELYNELLSLEPDILEGINKESINYDKLRGNLASYNTELKKSIALEFQKESLKPATQKLWKANQKIGTLQIQFQELFEKAASITGGQLGKQIKDIAQNDKRDYQYKLNYVNKIISEERVRLQNSKNIEERKKAGALVDIEQTMTNYISTGTHTANLYRKAEQDVNEAQNEYDKALKKSDAALKNMGISWNDSIQSKEPKEKKEYPLGNTDDPSSAIAGISAGGSKATNITITFKDLIGEMKITPATMKEGAEQVRDIVNEQMLKVLNSANRIATQ